MFVSNNSVFCTFSFFAEDYKMGGTVVFILKISCFLFSRYWQLTLKGFSKGLRTGAVHKNIKIQNVWFCPVMMLEKFTA